VEQQIAEVGSAREALKDLPEDAAVYKNAGALMIQVKDVETLKAELDERAEELEVKSKSYSKHEESLKKTVEELRTELSVALGAQEGPPDQVA
jgi:prefoldin beta subunit